MTKLAEKELTPALLMLDSEDEDDAEDSDEDAAADGARRKGKGGDSERRIES